VQTFLPYPDFAATARVLDRQRLGKQRVEAWQILRTLTGVTQSWRNHPAVLMWAGYEEALSAYGRAICREWRIGRGYKDTMYDRFPQPGPDPVMPWWLGDPAFHAAHRSNLLRKAPDWYGQFGWSEPDDLPYEWPTRQPALTAAPKE
jgi:hypothetical protein